MSLMSLTFTVRQDFTLLRGHVYYISWPASSIAVLQQTLQSSTTLSSVYYTVTQPTHLQAFGHDTDNERFGSSVQHMRNSVRKHITTQRAYAWCMAVSSYGEDYKLLLTFG